MPQKGDRRRGKPLNPDLGYSGDPVHHASTNRPPQRIGIRELRQQASKYIRRVENGETIEVTDRGRPVALLVPIPHESRRAQLIASGRLRPASGDLLDLGEPLPPAEGEPLLSEILAQMREDER